MEVEKEWSEENQDLGPWRPWVFLEGGVDVSDATD